MSRTRKHQFTLTLVSAAALTLAPVAVFACTGALSDDLQNNSSCQEGQTVGPCSYDLWIPAIDQCDPQECVTDQVCTDTGEDHENVEKQHYIYGDTCDGTAGGECGGEADEDGEPISPVNPPNIVVLEPVEDCEGEPCDE